MKKRFKVFVLSLLLMISITVFSNSLLVKVLNLEYLSAIKKNVGIYSLFSQPMSSLLIKVYSSKELAKRMTDNLNKKLKVK